MMIKQLVLASLAAQTAAWDFGFPFTSHTDVQQDFSCSVAGAGGEDMCDASKASDGSQCVWCSLESFGVCVSDDQAEAMKKAIPGLTCDDNSGDDAVADDDTTPDTDDAVPDDYWKCLSDYTDEESCEAGGCTWCMGKAGFGVCLDSDAGSKANDSDWFDCNTGAEGLEDPYDTSCLMASLQQDETACEATLDEEGNKCEWCTVSANSLCLTSEQAAIAEQIGGDCSTTTAVEEDEEVEDPYDTSCLMASLQQDESVCEATVDEDGNKCEWCTVSANSLCLNSEQAAIAEQIGGDCSTASITEEEEEVEDPYDTSCLMASLQQDESACESTVDEDGNKCAWCTVSDNSLCLTGEQADIVEQIGGDCSTTAVVEEEEEVEDPYDTSCLMASLQQDESACEATVDEDGNKCEWCTVSANSLCLTAEQAAIAEQIGGDCSAASAVEEEEEVEDPYDTSCLLASLQQDESACEATVDEDGNKCEWCTISDNNLCLTDEQAEIVEQIGGDCASPSTIEEDDVEVEDPYDTSCLMASLQQDESACEATVDQDGNKCEWCSISGNDMCLNAEQATIVEQIGGDCAAAVAMSQSQGLRLGSASQQS